METSERENLSYKLSEVFSLYNKTLEPAVVKLWLRALADKPWPQISDALDEHMRVGKYAPRPVDILEILFRNRDRRKSFAPPVAEEEIPVPCPDNIHRAWVWFIHKYSGEVFGKFDPPTPAEEEEYLLLVNQEAKRINLPDAIPNEFKLREVWGNV